MRQGIRALFYTTSVAGLLLTACPGDGAAQSNDDVWNPFKWLESAPSRRKPAADAENRADLDRVPSPPPRSGPVEAADLAPVEAPDGSGLPLDLWPGLSIGDIEQLLVTLDLPPRSPVLHQLWQRMLLASASAPDGAASEDHFTALRLEALYRSGLLDAMDEALGQRATASPLAQVIHARKQIGIGAREEGCRTMGSLAASGTALRGRLKSEAQLLAGYCAAAAGDAAATGLAANLAREEGVTDGIALHVLDSLGLGTKERPPLPARMTLLDYRFLTLLGPVNDAELIAKAEPALLVVLARAETRDMRMKTAAAEAALRLNALLPAEVAEVYGMASDAKGKAPAGEPIDPVLRRARLFRAVNSTQAPDLKGQLLRALLDDARRMGIYHQTARMLVPVLVQLWPSPETAPLAEPIVEIGLSAGEYDLARRWAETSGSLRHWLALIDLADGQSRGGRLPSLAHAEELAARGKLNAEVLHRLSTVIDALDMEVPMPIWEAAGRVPQPGSGYLPETGVLSELQQASQRKDVARTILVAMRAIGPNAADGASILALGDTIRALKRAGLEADARRFGVEALLSVWPRAGGH